MEPRATVACRLGTPTPTPQQEGRRGSSPPPAMPTPRSSTRQSLGLPTAASHSLSPCPASLAPPREAGTGRRCRWAVRLAMASAPGPTASGVQGPQLHGRRHPRGCTPLAGSYSSRGTARHGTAARLLGCGAGVQWAACLLPPRAWRRCSTFLRMMSGCTQTRLPLRLPPVAAGVRGDCRCRAPWDLGTRPPGDSCRHSRGCRRCCGSSLTAATGQCH